MLPTRLTRRGTGPVEARPYPELLSPNMPQSFFFVLWILDVSGAVEVCSAVESLRHCMMLHEGTLNFDGSRCEATLSAGSVLRSWSGATVNVSIAGRCRVVEGRGLVLDALTKRSSSCGAVGPVLLEAATTVRVRLSVDRGVEAVCPSPALLGGDPVLALADWIAPVSVTLPVDGWAPLFWAGGLVVLAKGFGPANRPQYHFINGLGVLDATTSEIFFEAHLPCRPRDLPEYAALEDNDGKNDLNWIVGSVGSRRLERTGYAYRSPGGLVVWANAHLPLTRRRLMDVVAVAFGDLFQVVATVQPHRPPGVSPSLANESGTPPVHFDLAFHRLPKPGHANFSGPIAELLAAARQSLRDHDDRVVLPARLPGIYSDATLRLLNYRLQKDISARIKAGGLSCFDVPPRI